MFMFWGGGWGTNWRQRQLCTNEAAETASVRIVHFSENQLHFGMVRSCSNFYHRVVDERRARLERFLPFSSDGFRLTLGWPTKGLLGGLQNGMPSWNGSFLIEILPLHGRLKGRLEGMHFYIITIG